jgi:PAS domain S-box-containing protein
MERPSMSSDAYLHFALQAARVGTWQLDVGTRHFESSTIFNRNFGLDPATALSYDTLISRIHPDDQATMQQAVDRAVRDMTDYEATYRVVWPDTTVHWIFTRGEILRDQQGQPARMVGISLDITDRKHAEEALRASESRYRLALRAAHGIIWDWDIRKRTVLWGESIRTVLGYPADEHGVVIGDDSGWWRGNIHPDDLNRVVSGLTTSLAVGGGETWSSAYRFRRADGTYARVLDKGCIERDKEGLAIRMVGSVLDITHIEEQENAIRALNHQLQERIDELEKFEEVVVGRELKMMDLEKELTTLKRNVDHRATKTTDRTSPTRSAPLSPPDERRRRP